MADGDVPQINQPVDPQVIANLMSGAGPAPISPGEASAVTIPQQPSVINSTMPPPSVSADTSQMPQQLASIIQSISKPGPQQAATQQATQQAAGNQMIQNQIPQPRPVALDLINAITGKNIGGPKPNVPGYQPPSKLDHFENFLGNFLTALSAGFANEGHGPGAAYRGAGAAMQAPYQQALQQYQLGIQQRSLQSQEQLRAAQEEFNRQRALEYSTQIVPEIGADGKPTGNMLRLPAKEAGPYMARIGAAGIKKSADEEKIDPQKKALNEAIAIYDKEGASQAYFDKIKEATQMSTALKPGAASPFGKLSPEMAAVGMPPNWADLDKYPGGLNDPQFKKDVQEYGQKVTALKQANAEALAKARGESYAYGRAKYLQVPVLDQDAPGGPTPGFKTPLEIASATNPDGTQRYIPLVEGDKIMMRNGIFEDIQGANKLLRQAITDNKDGFSASQVVLMTAAMNSIDAGGTARQAIDNLVQSVGRGMLTDPQKRQAIATLQGYENAYALRGVAGFGSGSDQLRNAIRATYPSAGSPPDYALKQMDAVDGQVSRLLRGIPKGKLRPEPNKPLDDDTARKILDEAGGDTEKARKIAKDRNLDTTDNQKKAPNKDKNGFTILGP